MNGFKDKNILITGGLGFIGSNLTIKLVELGANIILVDAMIPEYGGNIFNIDAIKNKVTVNYADIRDEHVMNYLVRDKDFIFHLAAQVSHVKSLTDPFPDIDINIKGTAILLEACKNNNKNVKIIRAGTRGQYGNAKLLPVNEEAPTNPKGIYEISQLTAEKMMQVYNDIYGVRCVLLRLTNIYGPRSQMKSSHFGVVNWFIRLAIAKQEIKVFGDGLIKRDFLYIDDCINGMLLTALNENCYGEIFNVGNDQPSNFLSLVKLLCELEPGSHWNYAPFTPERAAQEPGDFYSDITKISKFTGWRPEINLNEGLQRTLDFIKKIKKNTGKIIFNLKKYTYDYNNLVIIFRKYTKKDLSFIAEMQYLLLNYHLQFDKDYYEPSENSKDEFLSYITKKMDNDDFNIIIAESNEEIVGYVMGWIADRPPIYKIKKIGYLSNIFVNNTKRNSGVGRNLFSELEKWFVDKGIEYIETKSDARNTNTLEKFRGYGFKDYSITFYKKIKE